MSSDDDRWMDWDAGPVARPYTLTGGRTRPKSERYFDLVDVVACSGKAAENVSFSPERRQILDLCRDPVTVADLASATGLPLGVVRVLLADLIVQGRVTVLPHQPAGERPRAELLQEVLHGLRAL